MKQMQFIDNDQLRYQAALKNAMIVGHRSLKLRRTFKNNY